MTEATIWFDPLLVDLVKKEVTRFPFSLRWSGRRSVKDLIESLGVPHVEVDLILVNREPVDFTYLVSASDHLEVYGEHKGAGRSDTGSLRFLYPGEPRFICDVHLGKLARRLRLLGFDVNYRSQQDDEQLARISAEESRYLLSRDLQLLKRRVVCGGVFIRSQDVDQQLEQVCRRLELKSYFKPFSRCLSCNGLLKPLDLSTIEKNHYIARIPAGVKQWCHEYKICTSCDKIFWPGTHYQRLVAWVQKTFPQWPSSQSSESADSKE